jgi:hypothetical protein
MESPSTPRTPTSPTSPPPARGAARRRRRAAPLALLGVAGALLGCAEKNGPLSVNATVTIDGGIASAQAYFYQSRGGAVDFTGKARMTLDGVELEFTPEGDYEDPNAGSYHGDIQAIPAGEPYTFKLEYLDGVEMASFSIPMIHDAQIVAPPSGATLSTADDLVIRWSSADVAEPDQIQLVPPGSPDYFGSIYLPSATPGLAAMTISARQLQDSLLSGSFDVVLTRTRSSVLGMPFTGGYADVTSELSRVTITLTE